MEPTAPSVAWVPMAATEDACDFTLSSSGDRTVAVVVTTDTPPMTGIAVENSSGELEEIARGPSRATSINAFEVVTVADAEPLLVFEGFVDGANVVGALRPNLLGAI